MKKTFTLLAALALSGSAAYADSVKILSMGLGIPGIEEPQLMGLGISPDGRYVCGPIEMGMGYFVADTSTDEYKYEMTDDEEGAELRHVDNNGVAIGYNGPGITYSFATGEESVLQVPSGDWKYVLGEDITADGDIMIGSLVAKGFMTLPAYSKDGGGWSALPMPPAEKLGRYAEDGGTAKFVSGDGKYILGSIGNNMGPATLWVRGESGEYESDPFYYDIVIMTEEDLAAGEKTLFGVQPVDISNSGEYVLLVGTIAAEEGYMLVPVVYNTDTRETTIYDEVQDVDMYGLGLYPTAIADDGTFIGIVGNMPMYGSTGCFVMKPGDSQATLLGEAYPKYGEVFGFADSIGYVVPAGMSADGGKILGYGFYSEDFTDEESPAYFVTFVIDTDGGSAVESVSQVSKPEAIYSIDGRKLDAMKKGINIVRSADGSVRKMMKK